MNDGGEYNTDEYNAIYGGSLKSQGGVEMILNKSLTQTLLHVKIIENVFILA